MSRVKKSSNVEIGARLRVIRENLGKSQAELAELLEVSDEHYRKLESGSTGLTIEKVKILHEKLCVHPTYLITGKKQEDFDLERYLANCTKEQRDKFWGRCLLYLADYFDKGK